MKRIRKYMLAGGLAVVILASISIVLILGSRWLTGSDAVRKKIIAETARLTGGELQYEKLSLHLLPLPHLNALQVDFQVPGKISFKTEALAIYPDLMELVVGSFSPDDVVIVRPTARLELARGAVKNEFPGQTDQKQGLQEIIAATFSALARLGPDLAVTVKAGAIDLVRPGRPELNIAQIDLQLKSRGKIVTLDSACLSTVSGQLAFNVKMDRETRKSKGRLKVDGLNIRALLAELPPLPVIVLSDTQVDMEVAFSTEGVEKVKAGVICKVPDIQIQRLKHNLTLQNVLLEGDLAADLQTLSWDIKTLKIDSHGLDLGSAGTLSFGSRAHPAELVLEAVGRRIDVASVARSFTDFAGDQAWVPTAFNVAREGQLSKASCHLALRKTNGKWTVADLKAAGYLSDGLITIPGADLHIEAVSGEVVLDNQVVDFKQMQGRLHFGTFDELDARIAWHQAATLGISATRGTLALEKFYPWLTAFEGLQDLRKYVSTAEGELALTQLDLQGPLTNPAAWRIEVASGLNDVTLASPELAGPLRLLEGRVGFKPQVLTFDNLHGQYLDAKVVTSSKIMGKPGQPSLVHLALDGSVGEQALAWCRRFVTLPEHLRIKPPLAISGMNLQWDADGNVLIAGDLSTAAGTQVIADAAFAPGSWQIKRFELNDGLSDVSLKLTKADHRVELDYAGKLQKATLDRILQDNQVLKGWVDGELKAFLDIKNPRSSSITGALRGEGLIVQWLPVSPVEFKRFFLDCRGKNARLESADIVFAGTPMRLEGVAEITAQAYTFDLDLAADSLDAAALSKIQKAPSTRAAEPESDSPATVPINGVIRFKTPRFTFKDYTWSPVQAEITILPGTTQVTVTEADICGISTPGTVTIEPDGLRLSFKPTAVQKNIQATWQCLQSKPLQADSLYSLNATVEARGPADALVKNLQGDISFSSDNGTIYRANMLTRIFSFLNLTEVFAGKVSGVGDKGFGYATMRAHAALQGGVLNFDEILVDGHSMKISGMGSVNLVTNTLKVDLLVAPLKTFDRIVKNMPVVGYITGGSVLSAPVRIKGRTADPQVVPLPPAAVGRGLAGILERTLKAPLKIVESLPKNDAARDAQEAQAAESRQK